MNTVGESMKNCTKCGKLKPLSEFHKDSSPYSKDGFKRRCKECMNSDNRKRKKTMGRGEYNKRQREYRAKNKEEYNRQQRLRRGSIVERKRLSVIKREELLNEGKKQCSQCGKIDTLSEFYKDRWVCKECEKKTAKKYKEGLGICEYKGCDRKIKSKNVSLCTHHYNMKPEIRFINAEKRAKRRKKSWNIGFREYLILINKECHYCKKSLLEEEGIGLDRIDNSKGYVVDNVLPCCGECNHIRADKFSIPETKIMVKALKEFRNEIREGNKS